MNNVKIDIDTLTSFGIPDLRAITENGEIIGIRGQSLSCRKNRRHIESLKNVGINTIIDLRTGDYRNDLLFACESKGLKYCHIPIDKKHTPATEIIKRLPSLIESISGHNFYISCTQGLHRTDTALALYFLFNPKAYEAPLMYGHVIKGKFRSDEIFGRVGSIYHSLTEENKTILGWDEAFAEKFAERKNLLITAQEKLKEVTV